MAALTPRDGPDPDDPGAVAAADQDAVPLSSEELPSHGPNIGDKSRSARHDTSDARPRPSSYAYAGRTRRGQPRPGTVRFNLMQSLGGIY
jgi:hypothetical protein